MEHFKAWAHEWRDRLVKQFNALGEKLEQVWQARPQPNGDARESRKQFALYVKDAAPELLPALFACYDDKDPSPVLWKMLKPKAEDTSKQDGV